MHKISFIAQDMTDKRAFGYVFGSPDTGHQFFGVKTEKDAGQVRTPRALPAAAAPVVSGVVHLRPQLYSI